MKAFICLVPEYALLGLLQSSSGIIENTFEYFSILLRSYLLVNKSQNLNLFYSKKISHQMIKVAIIVLVKQQIMIENKGEA